MLKRLAASLLVIALPAALTFVIWAAREDPPENSLAWHKQQYLALFNKRAGKTLSARCARLWHRVTGAPPNMQFDLSNSVALSTKLDAHRDALVRMSYLRERIVPVTNAPAQVVLLRAFRKAQSVIPRSRIRFTNLSAYDPNGIVVIITGYPDDLPTLEKLVREADLP